MSKKERLTVTVDRELVEAANDAVAAGHADSLSGWVNLALAERAAKERRLEAMAKAIAEYESVFGEITLEEIVAQTRADRARARVVRGRPGKRSRSKRKSA
jgi:hypothetical protein